MGAVLIRRLALRLRHAVLVLAGVSMLSFLLMELAPGNYFDEARVDPRLSPGTVGRLRERAGLDAPVWIRYVRWLDSIRSGEGGTSLVYQAPVSRLVGPRLVKTLQLALTAWLLSWALALALGIGSVAGGGGCARLADWVNGALASVPELALACAMMLLAARTGLLSLTGMTVPALVLGLSGIPTLLPHVRTSLTHVAGAPFLKLARAHGIGGWRFLWFYWGRAAMNPLISLLGLSLGGLLSSSLAVEVLSGWPGLGPLLVASIEARDAHVVTGVVMLSTLLFLSANTAADLLLLAADPRIRRPGQ